MAARHWKDGQKKRAEERPAGERRHRTGTGVCFCSRRSSMQGANANTAALGRTPEERKKKLEEVQLA